MECDVITYRINTLKYRYTCYNYYILLPYILIQKGMQYHTLCDVITYVVRRNNIQNKHLKVLVHKLQLLHVVIIYFNTEGNAM